MRAFGFTLNVLTLMGLSLAIGMLIDDAIVVRENIVRHLQRGKDHFEAARDGTAEIGLAVMATTFTIVAVFIPVAFMGGLVGRFFYEFGITVAAAVLVSLFVSFTLDPMLSSRWVDPDIEEDRHDDAAWARAPAALQPAGSTACTAATSGCWPGRCATAWPCWGSPWWPSWAASRSWPCWAATSCPTSTAASTRSRSRPRRARPCARPATRAREMVRRLKSLPDVEYTYTTIGEAGTQYRPVTEGTTYVKLKGTRGKTFSQVLRDAREAIEKVPGMTYGLFEAGPFGQKPIQISVRGPEVDELDRISRELVRAMQGIRGVADIETQPREVEAGAEGAPRPRDAPADLGLERGPHRDHAARGGGGRGGHHRRGRRRRQPRRARAAAPRPAALRRRPAGPDRAHGQGRRERRQDPGVRCARWPRRRRAPGPSTIRRKDLQREVRVSANPDGRSLGEITADIEAAAAQLSPARPGTTSCTAATPRS